MILLIASEPLPLSWLPELPDCCSKYLYNILYCPKIFGSDRSPMRGDFVRVSVRPCVILYKIAVLMSSSSILESRGQASKQAGRQASRQSGSQAIKQASKQSSRQVSGQALGRHSVGAMPWRGLLSKFVSPQIIEHYCDLFCYYI